jgi:hypothetical protein
MKNKKDKRVKPVPGTEVVLIECGKPTVTGRIYPSETMANAIARANREENLWVVRPGAEPAGRVRLKDVVGRAKLSLFEDVVTAHVQIHDTPDGKKIKKLMDQGAVEFRPRGFGSVVDGVVQEDYRLLAVSIVEKDDGQEAN